MTRRTTISARDQHQFSSPDSQPPAYSQSRWPYLTWLFLLVFAAISLAVLGTEWFFWTSYPDWIWWTADSKPVLPVRSFLISFFLTWSLFATGNTLSLCTSLLGKLVLFSLMIDSGSLLLWENWQLVVPVHAQQLAVGVAGLVVFGHTILVNAVLPSDTQAVPQAHRSVTGAAVLPIVVSVAVLLTFVAVHELSSVVNWAQAHALMGGMGPGVFLAQQLITIQLFLVGSVRLWLSKLFRGHSPNLTVIIPAHNEAHQIQRTIQALDGAASVYKARVRVLVMENGSSDGTATRAHTALKRAQHLSGEVHTSKERGKARALNRGLKLVDTDFFVRLDADTQVDKQSLVRAAKHFGRSRVACVGGRPIPQGVGFWDRMRELEALQRHGFTQVATVGFDGVYGIPGMFTMYRTQLVSQAGGFALDQNGEDTSMSLRLHQMGYTCLTDPGIKFYTETPQTMRFWYEQRTRWFRSLYHVVSHNRKSLFRGGWAGWVSLPFALVNGARRAMMFPLVVFGFICVITQPQLLHPDTITVLAVIFGLPFLMMMLVCLLYGKVHLLVATVPYMFFRLMRSWLTLQATLTLRFKPVSAKPAAETETVSDQAGIEERSHEDRTHSC